MWYATLKKRKEKNHIIISIDAEKGFDKTHSHFMIQKNPTRNGKKLPQHNKNI